MESTHGVGQAKVQISARPANVEVELKGWARVRGRLLTLAGVPVSDTPLVLRTRGQSSQVGIVNVLLGSAPTTDAGGAFDIPRVPPGPVEIVALVPGRASDAPLQVVSFEAAPASVTDVGDVAIDEPLAAQASAQGVE